MPPRGSSCRANRWRSSVEVLGDGNGVPLRAAFVNRFGEKQALTLAKSVDWIGWRRVAVDLPPDLNPPVVLVSIYVVRSLGGPPVHSAGALGLRGLAVVLPGSGDARRVACGAVLLARCAAAAPAPAPPARSGRSGPDVP